MQRYLGDPIVVPFESLALDPNNPRLTLDNPPGYDEPDRLFAPELQRALEQRIAAVYDVEPLKQSIKSQGWMPIDNIVVWPHHRAQDCFIVLEGNTRTVALRQLREELPKAEARLKRMEDARQRPPADELREQQALVDQLRRIVADTSTISVVPLLADSINELKRKLPRVLAVRHISGAKEWGNYAQDQWLLARYEQRYEEQYGNVALRWDPVLIKEVADEASLTQLAAKRQMRASREFAHFKFEFEDQLPDGGKFKREDYYLFENIVKRPWLREQFEWGEDAITIPRDWEQVLFDWVFKLPRGRTADDNPNVFYRHENVLVWDEMKRYDDKQGTSFASRLDVTNPGDAPLFGSVEAEWRAHKYRGESTAVVDQLLQQFKRLSGDSIRSGGEFLRKQLEELQRLAGDYLRMMDSVAVGREASDGRA